MWRAGRRKSRGEFRFRRSVKAAHAEGGGSAADRGSVGEATDLRSADDYYIIKFNFEYRFNIPLQPLL
jgi:hypothetical protein